MLVLIKPLVFINSSDMSPPRI